MEEKVTTMVLLLKVDLQCRCCHKKVKKLLCKFPQIRDQVYNEKQNTVTITVICCNPEKIRDKLCCKGGKIIKSIEIIEPPKPKPKEPPPKPAPAPAPPPPPAPAPPPHKECPPPPPPPHKECPPPHKECPPPPPPPPHKECPPPPPRRGCCDECSEGRSGGPCYHGYGRPYPCFEYGRPAPPPPPPCYGRPIYDSYGGMGPCYMTRCNYYICEENPSGCSIM